MLDLTPILAAWALTCFCQSLASNNFKFFQVSKLPKSFPQRSQFGTIQQYNVLKRRETTYPFWEFLQLYISWYNQGTEVGQMLKPIRKCHKFRNAMQLQWLKVVQGFPWHAFLCVFICQKIKLIASSFIRVVICSRPPERDLKLVHQLNSRWQREYRLLKASPSLEMLKNSLSWIAKKER